MDIRAQGGLEFSRTFYRAIGANPGPYCEKCEAKCEKCEAKCEKCEAKCEEKCKDTYPKGTLIYASKTSIVATLFRSKIILPVK
jgi:hypothetical protein